MQLVVETAGVADRLPGAVPPPEGGGGGVAVGALGALATLRVLQETNVASAGIERGEEMGIRTGGRLDQVSD